MRNNRFRHAAMASLMLTLVGAGGCAGSNDRDERLDRQIRADLAEAAQEASSRTQFVSPMELGYSPMPYGAMPNTPYGMAPYGSTPYPPAYPSAPQPARVVYVPSGTRSGGSAVGSGRSPVYAPATRRNAQKGAVIGAASGAVIGAVSSRDRLKGAAIGAIGGAVLGGVIGHQVKTRQ